MPDLEPVGRDALAARLAEVFVRRDGVVRVGLDGAPATRPDDLAAELAEPVRAAGRPFVHVRADLFWRDASLRLEYGHEDADSYLTWLDARALQREVLTGGMYLPSLRDPVTDRSTHEAARPLPAGAVLVVSGALLLGLGLAFDTVVHLSMSPAALARHTPAEQAWTLPAFARYAAEVDPGSVADVLVRLEDPRRPAVRWGPT